MRVDYIVCSEDIEDKLESKHNVTCQETRQVYSIILESVLRKKEIEQVKMCMPLLDKQEAEDIWLCFLYTNLL